MQKRTKRNLLALSGIGFLLAGTMCCCSRADDGTKSSDAPTTTPSVIVKSPMPSETAKRVHYASCKEAQADGVAPLVLGDPGYSRELDRDGDGRACE